MSFDHASKVSTPNVRSATTLAGLASELKLHPLALAAWGVFVNSFICAWMTSQTISHSTINWLHCIIMYYTYLCWKSQVRFYFVYNYFIFLSIYSMFINFKDLVSMINRGDNLKVKP